LTAMITTVKEVKMMEQLWGIKLCNLVVNRPTLH